MKKLLFLIPLLCGCTKEAKFFKDKCVPTETGAVTKNYIMVNPGPEGFVLVSFSGETFWCPPGVTP